MSSRRSPPHEPSTPTLLDARALLTLASIGFSAMLLHGMNLLYLAESAGCDPLTLSCPEDSSPWETTDTRSYLRVADEIRAEGLFDISLLSRLPGYPTILALGSSLTGTPTTALWLGPPLAGVAALAISWIAFAITRRRSASIAAGLVFCFWPNAYQFSGLMLTDGIHGFLAVTALAATLWWRHHEHVLAALASAALWGAAQTLRLTFFPVAIMLPILLWKRRGSRRYLLISSVLWASLLVVPLFVIGSNGLRHGLPTPSAVPATNLACYAVPRLKEEMGQGEFLPLREDCFDRFMALAIEERVEAQLEEARRFLLQHPVATLNSFRREILEQMTSPSRPHYRESQASLYPSFASTGQAFPAVFWLCAAGGLLVTARRMPHLALFLLATLLVLLPTFATSHLVGARLRFPLDLLFIPMAVVLLWNLVTSSKQLLTRSGPIKLEQ